MKNMKAPSILILGFMCTLTFEIPADQLWTRSPSSVSKSGAPCYGFEHETLKSQEKVDSLTQRCLREVLAEAPANTFRKSDDGRFSVVAWKDMIFIEKHGLNGSSEFEVVRAKNPELNFIKAVATDASKEELYLLDESASGETQLLVYKLKTSGDQSPRRIVRGEFLKGADSLSLDPVESRLYLGHRFESKITVLRQFATIHHGAKEIHNPQPLMVHILKDSVVSRPSSVSVDPQTQNIYVYDSDQNKAALVRQRLGETVIESFQIPSSGLRTLNVNTSQRKLEILGPNGVETVSLVE